MANATFGSAKKAINPSLEVWLITDKDIREIDRIDVDLIISRKPIHTTDVECIALMEDNEIAVCGAQLALNIQHIPYPKILENAPLLFLESAPEWNGRLSTLALKNLQISRGATIDDSRLLLEAIQQNLGIGFISKVLANQKLLDESIKNLTQIPSTSLPRLWLMRSTLSPRTPFANQSFNWLRESINHQNNSVL